MTLHFVTKRPSPWLRHCGRGNVGPVWRCFKICSDNSWNGVRK